MQRNALVVFAKTPRPGASKTRLVPPLSYAAAATLSGCFIADVAAIVTDAAACTGATPCTAYEGEAEAMRALVGDQHTLIPQRGIGFGARLQNVAADAFERGFESVCLIGSDSPTLPSRLLVDAVRELQLPGDRIVLGPAEDGGYYLLGLKKLHLALFDNRIAWSTRRVAAQTMQAARDCGVEPALIGRWYDVDDLPSLEQLRNDLAAGGDAGPAPITRAHLARIDSLILSG